MQFKKCCLISLILFGFVQGLLMCVIGILVDYGGMYFEVNIANHDLARKTLLKSAVVHIVVFFITCVIYHVKCKEEVLMEKMVEGPSGKPQYQRLNEEEHS